MEGKRSSAGQLLVQKKEKPKQNQKTPKGNTVHCFEVETTPGTKTLIPQTGGSAGQRQYNLIDWDTPAHHWKTQKGIR